MRALHRSQFSSAGSKITLDTVTFQLDTGILQQQPQHQTLRNGYVSALWHAVARPFVSGAGKPIARFNPRRHSAVIRASRSSRDEQHANRLFAMPLARQKLCN
jgi:hypothetical protein